MAQKLRSANRSVARKFLMALLCLVAAATFTLSRPATVQAYDCSDLCEYVCDSVGSSCGWIWYSESGCDFGCD